MRRIFVLAVAIVGMLGFVKAQNADYKWNVGLHGNVNGYQGDLGNSFLKVGELFEDEGIGISLGYYLSPTFDVLLKGSYFYIDYMDTDGTYAKGAKGYADLMGAEYGSWRFNNAVYTGTANVKFKFNNGWLLKEDALISPFAIGGIGVTRSSGTATRNDGIHSKTYSNMAFYYGGGLNFRVSERFNVVFEAGIYNPMTDVYDGIDPTTAKGWVADVNDKGGYAGKSNDEFLQYSLGLTYNFGKKKDADGDGVADRKDKCPDTPAGVAVDENGCPIDTDGDGVPDYLDECPNQAGTVKGCPDTDKDGIADKDDACPKVKGLKKFKGCPDTDNDGVEDAKDKCPNTPAGVKVDAKGCPVDTDGDGIADYLDKCPNEAGVPEEKGCPKKEIVIAPIYFDRVVNFNTGKTYIRRGDIQKLNEVVAKMQENTTLKATISGHTDSVGGDAFNLRLSERRANAVKKYLVKKGIQADRIATVGYGEFSPVATNATAKGRAENRRAEIRIRLN